MDEEAQRLIAELRAKGFGDRQDWGYLDECKNIVPCSLADLVERCGVNFFELPDHFVADDYYGEMRVSTIFLRFDHNFMARIGFGGTSEWFETMVFESRKPVWGRRYATYADALAGHQAVLTQVMNGFINAKSNDPG